MFFRDIIGQKVPKEKLLISIEHNRVSHAQLFLGPEGNGSLALALAFAQFINCENRKVLDSCGTCPSCIKSQKMIHPDIHFSYPVFKLKPGAENPALSTDFIKPWREAVLTNPYLNLNDWLDHISAENKQGAISADECRDVIQRLNLKTFESPYKVMIIWRPEFFTQGGRIGNMLLKLLEEPPANTIIVLIAENRDELLSTILSRCQILSIPRISDHDLIETLIGKHSLHNEAAAKIVRQCEGNYREALRLLNTEEDDQPDLLKRWMQILFTNNAGDLVKWIEEVARMGREKQKSFFRYSLEFFRECVVLQQAGEPYSKLHDEEKKMASWFTEQMNEENWKHIETLLEESHYHIERNASPKILFMNLSLRLRNLINSKKLILTTLR